MAKRGKTTERKARSRKPSPRKTAARTVCVVTGTRSEYGLLKTVMRAIQSHPRLRLQVVATGMHLLPKFGMTVEEIRRDGFSVDAEVDILETDDTREGMARSVGRGVVGLTAVFAGLKPDIVLVLGDRLEVLAAAISAAYTGIPVAHIHGGDVSGGMDEFARHAVTKMSHIHFAATKSSAIRIKKMGEDAWRVKVVGAPGLDTILHEKLPSKATACKAAGINPAKPYILVVQHPVSTSPEGAAEEMVETLEAVKSTKLQAVLLYPNADAGGQAMITAIKSYERDGTVVAHKSLPHPVYLSLLKHCSAMVGNSSSGIIEAPSFGLPVVNIGNRQDGRERGANVIDVEGGKREIASAISKAMGDKRFRDKASRSASPYGDGHAGERIAAELANLEITPKLLNKRIAY